MTIFSVPNLGHVSNDFSERVNRNYPLDCRENKGVPEKIYTCFINFTKAFDFVDHNKLWKIFKRWAYQTTLPASWETYMQVKKQQLELDMEELTGERSTSRLYIVILLI